MISNDIMDVVMGVRGRRVHLIEALSDTIISFEKGHGVTFTEFPPVACLTTTKYSLN